MTKEEILAMEAGKELDKLVAEVLGDVEEHPAYGKLYHHFRKGFDHGWAEPAPVSTDISAAWGVVEKMKEEGYFLSLLMLGRPPIETLAQVCFSKKIGGEPEPFTAGKVTEAICKAALLAKVEDEFLKTTNPVKRMGY